VTSLCFLDVTSASNDNDVNLCPEAAQERLSSDDRIRRKSVRNSIESFEDRWWRDNIRASSGRRLLPDDLDTVQRHLDDTKNRLGGCDVDNSLSLLVVRFALKLQKKYLEAKQ
jgi:hypothetical protein